ncbi:MAG: precorrin-6A/cobalt-precorrin-6A reductase [Oscillatoria sp. SIO1A7]|nr:precorrin-6A/cobalt-precorrin-6A reductase [Oscillatoria sp. SIO1A7]
MRYRVNPGRIWLIGGTSESGRLARAIYQSRLPCTVSVTASSARSLYPADKSIRVFVGKLDAEDIGRFLHEEEIAAILDASHPYAIAISQLAISAAAEFQIPYLRYERPSVREAKKQEDIECDRLKQDIETENTKPFLATIAASDIETDKNLPSKNSFDSVPGEIEFVANFETLLAGRSLEGRRVLLTVGYRTLPLFLPWQDRCTLFARILPSVTALETALAAGFTQERLIALRPPIPIQLERSLWQHWQIQMVVTKASGAPGGEDVKRQLAAELGLRLVIIDRPKLEYPAQTSDFATALEFCHRILPPNFAAEF